MTQNRLKSWATWAGAAGALWVILSALGVPGKIGITNETFNTVLTAVGSVLVGFGILNNPTDKENF